MTRHILVTGGNKGIGLAIVSAIAREHHDVCVYLGSRDAARGAAARDGLIAEMPEVADRVRVLEIDVSSDTSVSHAAKQLHGVTLFGVVNNAGIGLGDSQLRAVLEVNTLGVRRVCDAFAPMLDARRGRIVNVTSASGPNFVHRCSGERQRFFLDATITAARMDAFLDECLRLEGPDAFAAAGLGNGEPYGLSKACANTYTLQLAREYSGLKINACTPGFIETDLTRPYADRSGRPASEMGMKPPSEGTRAPLHLLFADQVGSGHYYGSDAKRSPLDRYRAPGSPAYDGG